MNQTDFRTALLDPDLPVPAGLTDPQGRPAGRRFDVYRNNVTVSLTEALRQAYPVVCKLVGDDFFSAMAREHLRKHPPQSPLLMFYGTDMPAFLESFPPVRHLGYLPDVARLELALREAYHAADGERADIGALGELGPEALVATRLRFQPAVRLLRSDWPVLSIWAANSRGEPAPVSRQAEDVLIVRPDFDPEPLLLPPGGGAFVAAVMSGETLGKAAELAPEALLAEVLGLLLRTGAIAHIKPGE